MIEEYDTYFLKIFWKPFYPLKRHKFTHIQQRFREHVGNKGPLKLKSHFTECGISATEDDVSILGKPKRGEYRLLTLEALFIKELAPVLNTKDEYRSRTLTLKF